MDPVGLNMKDFIYTGSLPGIFIKGYVSSGAWASDIV